MRVHRSSVGTYHPDPRADVAWTVNDTRGYLDTDGPSCDECGACQCECEHEAGQAAHDCERGDQRPGDDCVGLSFAYVCLDGGETLCEACFEKAGGIVVQCDCA